MKYIQAVFIVLLATSCVFGPLGTSRRAIKQLDKGEYGKAQELVAKALEKDSLLPAALYTKAKILIAFNNPEQYDSAYLYTLKAQSIYDTLETDLQKKHQKQGFDSITFQHLKTRIDSLAFAHTQTINTEEAYNDFLAFYATAEQTLLAKSKRNALAFATAKSQNTYQSYKNFMEKYPEAVQIAEAKKRYEKLYFDKSTADGKVTSYIRFLEKNPNTPYRREAEQNIFEVVTSEHSVGGYELFINKYPQSYLVPKARDYAYHVAKQRGNMLPAYLMNDSLQQARQLEQMGLLAILEGNDYGFIDSLGAVVIRPQYTSINAQYKCEAWYKDFLQVDGQLKGRNGATISTTGYDEVKDLGYGLIQVKIKNKFGVIHKRGDMIEKPVYDQVKLINGNILALAMGDNWALKTVSNRLIVKDRFDDIFKLGSFILLEKDDQYVIKTARQLLGTIDNNPGIFDYKYTDYELLPDDNLWLKTNSGSELIVDTNLKPVLSSSDRIDVFTQAFVKQQGEEKEVYDKSYHLLVSDLKDYDFNERWLTGKRDSVFWVFNTQNAESNSFIVDSIHLVGRKYMTTYQNDSVQIFASTLSNKLSFPSTVEIKAIANADVEYLMIKDNVRSTILNQNGQPIAETKSTNLTPLKGEFIVFQERGKKGLIDVQSGDVVVQPAYEAIGNYTITGVSLLKDKKFGYYITKYKLTVPAAYDKNVIPYTDSVFHVEKNGKHFLLDRDLNTLNDKGYDDIRFWNDTLAFVRIQEMWRLYDLAARHEVEIVSPFRSYSEQEIPSGERIAVIRTEEGYGVLSNRSGVVVPAAYNDVVVLPHATGAIYFVEKHIREAEFYVAVYYDHQGKIIRKQAFEPDEYFKIYCEK